ncbi:unnamed protein product [Peniophora sp. CBMAI 1063]|nr:unnamed protein product [Peniophora sp. CBMAI 1063]
MRLVYQKHAISLRVLPRLSINTQAAPSFSLSRLQRALRAEAIASERPGLSSGNKTSPPSPFPPSSLYARHVRPGLLWVASLHPTKNVNVTEVVSSVCRGDNAAPWSNSPSLFDIPLAISLRRVQCR